MEHPYPVWEESVDFSVVVPITVDVAEMKLTREGQTVARVDLLELVAEFCRSHADECVRSPSEGIKGEHLSIVVPAPSKRAQFFSGIKSFFAGMFISSSSSSP